MSSQWRTVYRSANKQVRIKPRNHRSKTVPSERSPDLLRLVGGAVLVITAVMVAVEGWRYIVAFFILYGIGRHVMGRSHGK